MAWLWATASTFLVVGEPTGGDDSPIQGSGVRNLAPPPGRAQWYE